MARGIIVLLVLAVVVTELANGSLFGPPSRSTMNPDGRASGYHVVRTPTPAN